MIIPSQFATTCTACGGPIKVSEKIEWVRGVRGSKHASPTTCDEFRRTAAAPPAPIAIQGIVNFLQAAADRGMKYPKVRFLSPEKKEMRLSLASARSRNPGSVQIQIAGTWIGGILTNGVPSGQIAQMPDVLELLVAIADDPVNAAQAYGALMQRCSFCGLQLTDEGSVEVGYGPICAANWDMPWTRLGVPVLTEIPQVAEPQS